MLLVHCTVNGGSFTWVLGQSWLIDNATRTEKNRMSNPLVEELASKQLFQAAYR
jgi:hypothetical protein